MRTEITSESLKETRRAARQFLEKEIKGHNGKNALVVGLYGDLGAGKTAFAKEFATMIGIEETVSSPTFIIEKAYEIPKESVLAGIFEHFVHIDAYRLSEGEELSALGWKELISRPENLIFIEWPERVESVLPKDIKKIYFEFVDEKTRSVAWQHEL